jgi:hypothetical protein
MGFREVPVFEVREVLRLWLRGEGFRGVERLSGVDRKTARRYITTAVEAGLTRQGGEAQLTDAFMATVVEVVRPHRHDGHGATWRALERGGEALPERRPQQGSLPPGRFARQPAEFATKGASA